MIITAEVIRGGCCPNSDDKVTRFNTRLMEELTYDPDVSRFYLFFDTWGYDYSDIQFIVDAGYNVYRNSACLWWEVSW